MIVSASSSSVGAFSTLIDKLNQPSLNGSEFAAPRPANDGQKQFDARLAARLDAHPSKAEVGPWPDFSARRAPPAQPGPVFANDADVTRLSPRVTHPQPAPVSTSTRAPTQFIAAADPLAADKFLDDLESWLTQAKCSKRSQPSAVFTRPSTPKSEPSR